MSYSRLGALEISSGATEPCDVRKSRYAKDNCGSAGSPSKRATCEKKSEEYYKRWFCDSHSTRDLTRWFDPKDGTTSQTEKKGRQRCIISPEAKEILQAKYTFARRQVVKGIGAWNIDKESSWPGLLFDHQSIDGSVLAFSGKVGITKVDGESRRSVIDAKCAEESMLDIVYPGLRKKAEGDAVPYTRLTVKDYRGTESYRCKLYLSKGGSMVPISSKRKLAEAVADLNKYGYKSKYFSFHDAWYTQNVLNPKTGKYEFGPDDKDVSLAKADKAYARTISLPPTKSARTFREAQRASFDMRKQASLASSRSLDVGMVSAVMQTKLSNANVSLSRGSSWAEFNNMPVCSELKDTYLDALSAKQAAESARIARDKESAEASKALADAQNESLKILQDAGFSVSDAETSVSSSNSSDTAPPLPPEPQDEEPSSGTSNSIYVWGAVAALAAVFIFRRK